MSRSFKANLTTKTNAPSNARRSANRAYRHDEKQQLRTNTLDFDYVPRTRLCGHRFESVSSAYNNSI
jgi:hypothetical protein